MWHDTLGKRVMTRGYYDIYLFIFFIFFWGGGFLYFFSWRIEVYVLFIVVNGVSKIPDT